MYMKRPLAALTHEEYDVALTKYKIAIVYEPDSVALWNNIGTCFYYKQKYVAAISCLKRALWISPLNWKVLFNLGLVHLATQQPTSAFNFICAAVNLRPDIADSFAVLGCSLLELNDAENAMLAFKQALSIAPENPSILVNAAACFESAGSNKDARILLDRYKDILETGVQVPQQIMDLWEQLNYALQNSNSGLSEVEAPTNENVEDSEANIENGLNDTIQNNESEEIGSPLELMDDEV